MSDTTATLPEASRSHSVDDIAPIASYFRVDATVEANKLSTIAHFLRGDNRDMDEIDLLAGLRSAMWKLGDPPLGSSELDHAYEYAKLGRQIKEMETERARYER